MDFRAKVAYRETHKDPWPAAWYETIEEILAEEHQKLVKREGHDGRKHPAEPVWRQGRMDVIKGELTDVPQVVADIADRLGEDRSSISALLSKLFARGQVDRVKVPREDRKSETVYGYMRKGM